MNQKGSILTVLLIILGLAILGGGYYAVMKMQGTTAIPPQDQLQSFQPATNTPDDSQDQSSQQVASTTQATSGASAQEENSTASSNVTVSSSTVSVPGMSEYTDSDFGFSFWYPSGWTVTSSAASGSYSGGTTTEQLEITDPHSPSQPIEIDEVTFPTASITTPDAGCTATYSFDANSSEWMQTTSGCDGASNVPVPLADPNTTTMGGLPSLFGQDGLSTIYRIVPLSTTEPIPALVISGGQDQSSSDPLTATIVASDSFVATPESAAQQEATIEAEQQAYAGQ